MFSNHIFFGASTSHERIFLHDVWIYLNFSFHDSFHEIELFYIITEFSEASVEESKRDESMEADSAEITESLLAWTRENNIYISLSRFLLHILAYVQVFPRFSSFLFLDMQLFDRKSPGFRRIHGYDIPWCTAIVAHNAQSFSE